MATTVNQTIFRFSCCVMLYSNLPNTVTPIPFCELRAFKYLLRKPSLAETAMIKKELTKVVNDLLDKPGLQKTLGGAFGRGSMRADDRKCTKLEEIEFSHLPSGKIKVMINGFEKEPIDIIETKVHVDNTDIKHRIIKQQPKQVTYGYIYRYVAFFGKEGKIKGEYDEFDILNGALD